MRIVLIRHADPDYANDTLTEKGRREAALLAENVEWLELDKGDFFVSPLGRAQDTARYVLDKLGRTAQTMDWLQEFPAQVDLNDSLQLQKAFPDAWKKGERFAPHISWDMVPSYWTEHKEYFDMEAWRTSEVAHRSDIRQVFAYVTEELDKLLAKYGYVREGRYYRVEKESDITITCFCHMGVICVLLAHLWNVSPFVLWHSLAVVPSSVTEIYTEEREQGIAYFRAVRVGDISHLRIGKEKPSFSARFCELYSNTDERH